MSENIRGITFAEQTVTPADDAIVRRAMLSDGILSGCNITYSGSTLTMAAGYVIACGRIFQITAAQNWAIVDATSGVARLVLTIDLTKTATETAFDQIGFNIEYATAENGFVNLTQDDINIAGVRYQVAVAVVSLGAGGITGIVSKLERAEGGGGLNFKLVGGLTQPTDPEENMIWVQTDTKITSWTFSPYEPTEPVEGMLWIVTGTSGTVEFNALKKNEVLIYISLVRQYVDGGWYSKDASIYQDNVWVKCSSEINYLYDNGKTSYQWEGTISDSSTELIMVVDHIGHNGNNGDYGRIYSADKITILSGFTKLCLKYYCTGGSGTGPATHYNFVLRSDNGASTWYEAAAVASVSIPFSAEETVVTIDITSALHGQELYVGMYYNSVNNINVYKEYHVKEIWFE